MKAVLCREYGPPESLAVAEIPDPEPGDKELLIEIHAASVNFPDFLMIQNLYQFKPALPFTPGSEVAGVVTKAGPGATRFKPGDRVIGSSGHGGFAELIALNEERMIPVPEGMDFTTASALILVYGTSIHALIDRAALQAGENLLVLGAAGGVGLAAVEIGKALGARVIAAASSSEKCRVARDHGADDAIVYSPDPLDRAGQKAFADAIKQKTGGAGADVVYDPVGGTYSEPALRATNWNGRFLVIGFAAGDIPRLPLNLPLLKVCQIVGVFWGAFTARYPDKNKANIAQLTDWFKQGKIRPHVSRTYRLNEAGQALADIGARKVTGKIVVTPRA